MPAPGVRFKAFKQDRRQLRLVEFTKEFIESDWSTKGHIGFILEGEMEIKAICPTHPNSSRWIFYYCLSDDFTKQFKGSMAGLIGGVSINKFKELSVPLAPLAEQQRIVGLLDEAFEGLATAKANAEKNLQNARALFESHLQSVFTKKGRGVGGEAA